MEEISIVKIARITLKDGTTLDFKKPTIQELIDFERELRKARLLSLLMTFEDGAIVVEVEDIKEIGLVDVLDTK